MPRYKLFLAPNSRYARTRNVTTLMLLFIPCAICYLGAKQFMPRKGDPTPTLYALPTFARPLTPTFEIPPSFTPVITHTPSPTPEPKPTSTPTQVVITLPPTSDDAQVRYANTRDDTTWVLRTIKADIDTTFGRYIEGKVSQYDTVWQFEMETYFDEFGSIAGWFIDTDVPEAFGESHQLTLSGLLLCSVGWKYLYDGALRQDADMYQDGVEAIAGCNQDWDAGDYAFWAVVLDLGLEWPMMSSPTVAP